MRGPLVKLMIRPSLEGHGTLYKHSESDLKSTLIGGRLDDVYKQYGFWGLLLRFLLRLSHLTGV